MGGGILTCLSDDETTAYYKAYSPSWSDPIPYAWRGSIALGDVRAVNTSGDSYWMRRYADEEQEIPVRAP